MTLAANKRRDVDLCGNTATGTLKLLALLFMVVDHAGAALFPNVQELRLLGRIAFPLYAWCLVVGAEYTRSIPKYALRLLALLAISQPFFMLALNHSWNDLNIFATLLLGLLGIYGIKEKRAYSQFWAPVLTILAACILKIDYGWKGVSLILLLYAARKDKGALAAVMIAFCLFWGMGTQTVATILGVNVYQMKNWTPYGASLIQSVLHVQTFALLSLPLMLLPFGKDIRFSKWVAYAAYPAHLLVIYLIKVLR